MLCVNGPHYYIDQYVFSVTALDQLVDDGLFSLAIMTVLSDEEFDDEPTHERHWALHKVAFGLHNPVFFPELDSDDDWATINDLLSQSPHLSSVDIFCGNGASEMVFNELVEYVCSELPAVEERVHGHYGLDVSDGREMASELFGTKWQGERLRQFMYGLAVHW